MIEVEVLKVKLLQVAGLVDEYSVAKKVPSTLTATLQVYSLHFLKSSLDHSRLYLGHIRRVRELLKDSGLMMVKIVLRIVRQQECSCENLVETTHILALDLLKK